MTGAPEALVPYSTKGWNEMAKQNGLLLSEFQPKSELVVERQQLLGPKFPVIDMHGHFGPLVLGPNYAESYDPVEEVEKLKRLGVRNITNLEMLWGEELQKLLAKVAPAGDFIITFGGVDITRLAESNFANYVEETLTQSKALGIKGLKLWKDISLAMHIPMDDPRLQPIFSIAAKLDLPVLLHIADPVAFFRPIDQFNERYEELQSNPDWSFHGSEFYSFDELMSQQENMLAQNPDTTFIIAHGGSYPENLGYVAKCLDTYPNMYIDIAARIAEFGRQPYTTRKFFNKYQERILFGTDASAGWYEHAIYYEFLETWNEYIDYSTETIPPQGRWKIYGIGLDDEVLEKVYYKNAERILKL